jgi:FixJ family two-component response regulator
MRAMPVSVLLVDDDPGFRDLAGRMLTALGLDVIAQVDTVSAALAAAADFQPRAALVDVGLPDGDGVELAAELSALPWRPRVVLISSDPDVTTPAEARAAGAIDFLSKTDLPTGILRRLLTGSD